MRNAERRKTSDEMNKACNVRSLSLGLKEIYERVVLQTTNDNVWSENFK